MRSKEDKLLIAVAIVNILFIIVMVALSLHLTGFIFLGISVTAAQTASLGGCFVLIICAAVALVAYGVAYDDK